jgi:hypothetical protein
MNGRLGAVRRCLGHAALLAVVGLAIGLAAFGPTLADAQVQLPARTETPQTPTDLQLHVGETATVDDGALLLTLVEVTEDSRCPKDVMCVWMGRAVVALHVVVDGVDRGDTDVTLMPARQPQGATDANATIDRYVITLADLQPYPAASQPQPLDQRVATLRVDKSQ